MNHNILALYDFAAKQNFIYRTSKIREISGASDLLTGIFKRLVDVYNKSHKDETVLYAIGGEDDIPFDITRFRSNENSAGEVLYDGGGNLMMVFRDKPSYISFNKNVSEYILKNVPTLSMIACCVECTDDFESDVKNLYAQNRINKNIHPAYDLVSVIPVTQIDPMTFLPVVHKHKEKDKELSFSVDRWIKQKAYNTDENNNLENLEGMIAVIYIDGNSMGQKLIKCSDPDYNEGVKKLRTFSVETNKSFVETPLQRINEYIKKSKHKGFRRVIGGGDEITFICDARIALQLVEVYFEALKESNIGKPEEEFNYSCAGIAVAHAKAPFTIAYEIAEAACESAKQKAHQKNDNYFDFYYCHAGVTADFETLRSREQSVTKRPYQYEEAKELFGYYAEVLRKAGRSNVKALGEAAQKGEAYYSFEVERVNAYLRRKIEADKTAYSVSEDIGLIYDMAEFYDLWFAKGEKNEEND